MGAIVTLTTGLDSAARIASGLPFPAAILPGIALLAFALLAAVVTHIRRRYPRLRFRRLFWPGDDASSDIERQLLLLNSGTRNDVINSHDSSAGGSTAGRAEVAMPFPLSAAASDSACAQQVPALPPISRVPTTSSLAPRPIGSNRFGGAKSKALKARLGGIAARVEVLQQVCNLIVWMLTAECLVHTMLAFALRQEIARLDQGDAAVRLASWLAVAQICVASAWLLQLRYRPQGRKAVSRHAAPTGSAGASVGDEYRPVYAWALGREWVWLASLIASACELYAYINCTPSQWEENSDAQPATCSSMLRTLISIRIIANLLLVLAALHTLTLERTHRVLLTTQNALASATLPSSLLHQCPPAATPAAEDDDECAGAASYSSMATIDVEGGCTPATANAANVHPRLPLESEPLLLGAAASYGATCKHSATHTPLATSAAQRRPHHGLISSLSDLSSASREEDDEEDAAAVAGNNDDSDLQSDALRSGVKKVRMYHQSDELSHDIMGLRNRLRILLPYLWPSDDRILQLRILGCVLILAAGRLVNVLVPLQFKIVVDGLSPKDGSTPKFEWGHVILYAILSSLQGSVGMLSTAQSFMWIPVGQATTKRISVAMFEHLHKLSLRFHVGRKTGEILRVQDRGVTSVVSLLSSILFNIIPTLVDIVLACYFFSVMFDLYFGTIVLTTMVSYLGITILLTGWRSRYRRLSNYLDNEMEARAVDSLLNFETVKYYNAERFEGKEYIQAVDDFQVAEWASNATMNMLNTGQNLIVQMGLLAGALLSAKRVSEGKMTVGDFTMLLSYINQLYGPLNWFGTYYRVIQKNFIDMEKLLELFDVSVEVEDPAVPVPLKVTQGEVVFDNVSFSYEKQLTLKNVSFKVPAGSTVAIVGPSGSGKSTILRLLFRFYDVQAGRILIDGQDIRSVPQFDLRQAIGVVPQDTVLFNDSIRYNIAYGRAGGNTGVTMKDVTDAADAAHIHSRIMGFCEQYETRVGERGQRLSGGEKQRVAIARTLLKDPKIVCLDEATSALDTSTERQIQTSLRDMTRDRTTLIIAHRLSTVIHADQILIVQNGQIVERGTHSELISDRDSVYYDMWIKQLTDAANASYDPILEQANIQLPISAALASDFCSASSPPPPPQHQRAHSNAGERFETQLSADSTVHGGDLNSIDTDNGDGKEIETATGNDSSSNSRDHHAASRGAEEQPDQTVPDQPQQQLPIAARRHSRAGLLRQHDTRENDTCRQANDHMNLVIDEGALPSAVLSQGWMAFGPLTAPLPLTTTPAASAGHLGFPGLGATASPAATTSSSLSDLDLHGLAAGVGSRSGGATASGGLLLDGMGMSLCEPVYHISERSKNDDDNDSLNLQR